MIFTVSYEACLPNAIDRGTRFSLVKIKQLRFAYLEGFIFYAEEDRIVSHDAFFQKHHAISQS